MVQKIKDFILKDVQSENETKKTAVTLRISALMLCLYFLTLFAVFCAIKDIRSAVICLVCIGCYLVSFYTTYLNHTKFASIFSQALMALWILKMCIRDRYRIGGRLRTWDASFKGVAVGIPPLQYWISNQPP